MEQTNFSMAPQKNGRVKYLLLTLIPPLLLMGTFSWLIDLGILPSSNNLSIIYLCLSMGVMMVLAYFFIFKKNHMIDIKENTITETDWCRNTTNIHVRQIKYARVNLLKEICLFDTQDNILIRIERNMSNREMLYHWLDEKNISFRIT